MNLQEALRYGEEQLAGAGIADAKVDAFTLLEMASGANRTICLLSPYKEIDEQQIHCYKELIAKRAEHVPCQYLTGTCEFMGYPFEVNPFVLIPRQDTETLVEEVLKILPENPMRDVLSKKTGTAKTEENSETATSDCKESVRVLDMCTGSGAIAIALQCFRPDIKVMAADISPDALNVAKRNCGTNHCRIDFVQSNLFEAIPIDIKFDAIVSNPPYVSDDEYECLMTEVKDHEPELALKAGEKGLDIYERLIPEAVEHLKKESFLALEIGCGQREDVKELMEKAGFAKIKAVKDLAGLDRVVIGWLL